MKLYVLEGHEPVPWTGDFIEWGRWLEKPENRFIRQDNVTDEIVVSTVFLGLDHAFGFGPPLVFETMVFRQDETGRFQADNIMQRYRTWDEAVAGHEQLLAQLRAHYESEGEAYEQ